MPARRSYLERTRGRILGESERLRVMSEVTMVNGAELLGCRPRGTIHLALTDRRLLVVRGSWLVSRARVLAEFPTGRLSISTTTRRIGGNLIHIGTNADRGRRLSFEWVRGHRPRDWEPYRFRQ